MYHRCHLTFSTLALAAAALAQAPDASKLKSHDWRERNATAVKLIKHKDTRNEDLLRILDTPWDGHTPTQGTGFGGRLGATDPRDQTLRSARREIGYNWPITTPRYPKTIDEVVGPWHPHKLATLVMLERGSADGLRDLQPTDTNRARIWVTCCKPNEAEIAKALADTETAEAVLFAILPTESNKDALLRKLITEGPASARRAALRMAGDMPLAEPQLLGTIEQLLNDEDAAYTRNAAHHLVRTGASASTLLKKYMAKGRSRRQLSLAVLCTMDNEGAKPATKGLLTCLHLDVTSQRRALVALSNFAVPENLQENAAASILALLEKSRSRIVRVLAADALATCGKGVSAEQRTRMHAMLQEPKFLTAHSRLLAALGKLNAVPKLEIEVHAKIAKSIHNSADSWVTLADRGEAAGPMLIKHKMLGPLVGERLAETAPDMLVTWLNGKHPDLQETALAGLLAKRPDLLESKQLAALLAEQSDLATLAFDGLCQRSDASLHVPQLLAFASNKAWLTSSQSQHIRRLVPSFATLTDAFQAELRIGNKWDTVLGFDDQQLRVLTRMWLQETEESDVRDRLVARLIEIGLIKGQDILLVERALASTDRSSVLSALDDADAVPAQLIPALEKVCDDEPQGNWSSDEWYAREALIRAHR
ncbi:MAG: hypothetical protein ACI91B_001014 [Planctomycetota bacterium]|jgi:hypothetical protein